MPKGVWKAFTVQELDFIRANYLKLPYRTMARELGVTHVRVKKTIERLGLKVPEELIAKRSRDSKYKKGNIPVNKGKKIEEFMSPEGIEKTKKNRFKNGHKPHNTKYNGCISIRNEKNTSKPYKWIRLEEGKWELLHRYVWMKETGERLKPDDVIAFKDGDTLNSSFSNLEKISREENMLRNSKLDLPDEIIPTMALNCKLNRIIESKNNQDEK